MKTQQIDGVTRGIGWIIRYMVLKTYNVSWHLNIWRFDRFKCYILKVDKKLSGFNPYIYINLIFWDY